MFYRKNIYRWEQVARILGGAALAVYGYMAMNGNSTGYVLIATGLITMVTGVFGFCPACAVVGRKLRSPPQ